MPISMQLQERLNRLGVCLSHGRRDVLLKLLGGHFADKVVERVKSGSVFRGTGDNWDLKVLKGHMRKDIQNEDLHLFASNLIENRVNFAHLPNDHPKADIVCFPRHKFSLNVGEWKMYADSAKVLVGRIICEFLPKFKWIKSVLPAHIPHRYSKEMAKKSTIVSLPIIDANEAKYEDCVHILRSYEKWIAEIYVKAGLLDAVPEVDNPPVPDGPAAPGQPDAHREDTPGDPIREMKMAFAGDQLTRVRFAGAKDLLSGSHTPSDRFEHCSPFKPVMWHTKASLLQYSYSFLHKAESVNQVGTLKYFREKFNRRNSTPSKVLDSYEGSEELFISVGRAYIISAALAFFGMSTVEDLPSKNTFPANICQETLENKKKAFDDIFGRFMDEFLFQKNASADVIEEDDFVTNYGLCFIFLTILLLQMKDTAAEADGERNLINQKLLLSVFKSMGTYSKYAIEMFISIAQIECMLTPHLAEEFKWGFFVNWRGGDGKNIEDDLAQEIQNRLSKSIVQRMGSNKTLQSISKVCKATNGITEVEEQFDRSVGLHKSSVQHTTRDSLKDELEMINDLMALNPFNKVPERCHDSFPDIKRCPLRYLNIVEFHQWLDKHKQELSNRT